MAIAEDWKQIAIENHELVDRNTLGENLPQIIFSISFDLSPLILHTEQYSNLIFHLMETSNKLPTTNNVSEW